MCQNLGFFNPNLQKNSIFGQNSGLLGTQKITVLVITELERTEFKVMNSANK